MFGVIDSFQTVKCGRIAVNRSAKKHIPDLFPAKPGIEFQNIKYYLHENLFDSSAANACAA